MATNPDELKILTTTIQVPQTFSVSSLKTQYNFIADQIAALSQRQQDLVNQINQAIKDNNLNLQLVMDTPIATQPAIPIQTVVNPLPLPPTPAPISVQSGPVQVIN